MQKYLYNDIISAKQRLWICKSKSFFTKTAAKIFVQMYSSGEATPVTLQNSNTFLPTTEAKICILQVNFGDIVPLQFATVIVFHQKLQQKY